mgnify:CR=1 FL=1
MSSTHNAPMRKHSFLSTWHSDCIVSNPSEGNILRYIGGKWVAINFADALVYKGVIDCSSNPNYPAADSGHVYKVSVAGKIGGASGEAVSVGDMMICNTDGTPAGDEATVGSYWNILQANIDFASDAECVTGTEPVKIVSPAGLTARLAAPGTIGGGTPAVAIYATTFYGTTFDTNVAAAGVTLAGTTLAADGTDVDININITPKGAGEVNLPKVDIDAGTIDGVTIATSDITVGAGKTLNVSAGTLTLADNQISGDKVEGGTIAATTITSLTSTTVTMADAGVHVWDVSPAANNGFSGDQESVTAGATVALRDVLYEGADGKWYLADADASATMPAMRMAVGSGVDGGAVNTITRGVVRNDSWTWTIGMPIYVSTTGTTGNTLTQTAPSGELDVIQIVGYAISSTTMYFAPSPITVEVGLDVEDDDAGSTITMAELSAIPKTFLCTTGAGDKTFTFDAPSASDIGKEFIIIKEDAGGAGKIILDAPDGVTISRAADTSSAGGTYTSEASKFQMIHVKIISATQLYVMKTDGTWTAA